MKKISLFICTFSLIFFMIGCSNSSTNSSLSKIDSIDDVTNKTGKLSCTRQADTDSGIIPSFNYYVTYKDDNILELHSIEKVTSDNSDSLDQYEIAYEKINNYYDGLEYYDTVVTRNNDTVTRDTVINYEKIDTSKLLAIEGEKDNIIENGKAKLSLWFEFGKKFGITCTED